MFCVFLQNIPPDNYQTIDVIHNDTTYTFSRELSLTNSDLISQLIKNSSKEPINLDYDFESDYDEFQLISDLFNYKRVFITRFNIDFLEFSANHLQIPILIKKTTKFRNHYHDFLQNPIFKEIKSLHKQVFSICEQKNPYNENDGFSDSDEEELKDPKDDPTGSQKNTKSEVTSNSPNGHDETTTNSTTDKSEVTATDINGLIQNSDGLKPIQKIEYSPEYATTVSHLIFSACLANPFNADAYLDVALNDRSILGPFMRIIEDINDRLSIDSVKEVLKKSLIKKNLELESYSEYPKEVFDMHHVTLDTNLIKYFHNDFDKFFIEIYEMKGLLESFVNFIRIDDIDTLQKVFASNENILNDLMTFTNLFRFSAILSAVKCFKYFLLNYAPLFSRFKFDKNMVRSAIIGGNIEIFRLTLENYSGNASDFLKDSIIFHRTDILRWIISNDIQFLSLYNCSCSVILSGRDFIKQKWYKCTNCHPDLQNGMCKFCAKHCHLNKEGENLHNPEYDNISLCFCDDDCPLSKNIEIIGNKKFVEIDDLILLSIYCLNTSALKILIDEGAYILRCRDRITRDPYPMNDEKLIELISSMRGYKPMFVDEISQSTIDEEKHGLLSLDDLPK